jgi:hypothetical protein
MKGSNVEKLIPPAPNLKLDPRPPLPLPNPKIAMAGKLPQKWNTKGLGLRVGADVVSAASASVLVAPVVMVIDR